MNRPLVGITIASIAAALSLAGTPHTSEHAAAFTGDPSVPSATEAFRGDTKSAGQGNVEDLAY